VNEKKIIKKIRESNRNDDVEWRLVKENVKKKENATSQYMKIYRDVDGCARPSSSIPPIGLNSFSFLVKKKI
jgi:hypothetical protein